MFSKQLKTKLAHKIEASEHPRELLVDVIFEIQTHYGYLSDEGLEVVAELMEMDPLEIEQLATFYTFVYREPVGKYVIHVCDSVICWMMGYETLREYLCRRLNIQMGETTADGLFTLLPVCCLGYCDRAPAVMINKKVYGHLTPEKLNRIIEALTAEARQESGSQKE